MYFATNPDACAGLEQRKAEYKASLPPTTDDELERAIRYAHLSNRILGFNCTLFVVLLVCARLGLTQGAFVPSTIIWFVSFGVSAILHMEARRLSNIF